MGASPANTNNTGEDNNCKKRFKGIETFLRKIAFNLGNSPSQTEVKIISCIPIDVTDLQNKIISLERQLFEAANSNAKTSIKQTPVHTALIEPTIQNTNTGVSCKCSGVKTLGLGDTGMTPSHFYDDSSKTRKSTVSFLFPTSSTGLQENKPFMTTENSIGKESHNRSIDSRYKIFFRRCKKNKSVKKKENRTQLVYYSQNENNPFTSYGLSTDIPKLNNALSKSYIDNVIQRHFDPEQVVEEFSDTSHFTSPVCRDVYKCGHCPYESDVCSCCQGHFQNVDKFKNKNVKFEHKDLHAQNKFNKDIYYDSNLYDIVPVKEKPIKIPMDDKIRTNEPKHIVDLLCWSASARTKVGHQSTTMDPQSRIHNKLNSNMTHMCHIQETKNNIKLKAQNHCKENKVDKKTGPSDTSKNFCIDCSEIYPKPNHGTHETKKPKIEPVQTSHGRNVKCLTIHVDTKNLPITRSVQIDINTPETKTEKTLSQIKSILQSVLAEVKTNPQVNQLSQRKSKKDVIIQKEPSQTNVHSCSSLLHDFTFKNSYNTNPYLKCASSQIPSALCYANTSHQHPNYTLNFPLLIQTPRHQRCECFYKNKLNKNIPTQNITGNTATDTEKHNQKTPGEETEKLIKEIYKSIALTIDLQKEISNNGYDEYKSNSNNYTGVSEPKVLQNTTIAMSDTHNKETQISPSHSTTTVSSNESQLPEREILHAEKSNRGKASIGSIFNEEYSVELNTDIESKEVKEAMNNIKDKMEKKSILKRMLGSLKLLVKKKKTKRSGKQEGHKTKEKKFESDSVDYQTIYSEKVPERHYDRNLQYKPKIYSIYTPVQEKGTQPIRSNRSPYMEQEYRRQWNEKLMFHENRGRRYSTERPNSFR